MQQLQIKFEVSELKTRLDKFLTSQALLLPEYLEEPARFSRSKIQQDIEQGFVEVNGDVQSEPKFVVRQGDLVTYQVNPEEVPGPKNIPLKTLYHQNDLLVVDKPAGLAVHPGAGLKGDSLAQALLYHFPKIETVGESGRGGIVHRLDKETSGVMLVALSQKMYNFLKESFAKHEVYKEYLALVLGKIPEKHGQIDAILGKSKRDFRKYTTEIADMVLQKPSLTEYWVQDYLTDGVDFYTLIKVKLHTGRTHQIRVHFSSLGFPLIGDQLYGGKKVMKFGLNRQFLHSKKIELQLPDGQSINVESELPMDLKKVLSGLKKVN